MEIDLFVSETKDFQKLRKDLKKTCTFRDCHHPERYKYRIKQKISYHKYGW